MGKREHLLEELGAVAKGMIQGSLSRTTRTCGWAGCRCHRGERHGPHLYVSYKNRDGRSRSLYVPPCFEDEATLALAAWKRFREVAAELAELNREAARARWRRTRVTRRDQHAKASEGAEAEVVR